MTSRISWLSVLAVVLSLAGCILAAATGSWEHVAVCMALSGAVAAILSLREQR